MVTSRARLFTEDEREEARHGVRRDHVLTERPCKCLVFVHEAFQSGKNPRELFDHQYLFHGFLFLPGRKASRENERKTDGENILLLRLPFYRNR